MVVGWPYHGAVQTVVADGTETFILKSESSLLGVKTSGTSDDDYTDGDEK